MLMQLVNPCATCATDERATEEKDSDLKEKGAERDE